MVERIYTEGAYLGLGYNSLTGEFRNRAIKVNSKNWENDQDLERETLQKVYFSFEHITDEKMLANSLEISGSGFNKTQAGFDPFNSNSRFGSPINVGASASFSAKARFFKQNSYNSSNTYILVKCLVENEKYRTVNHVLTDEASKILEAKDGVDRFQEKFGDEFVVGFSTGGEYLALIKASSSSEDSQTNLVADVRAEIEYHVKKLGFKADHESGIDIGGKIDKFQRNKNINLEVAVYRAGCQDIGHAFLISIEQIVQEVSILPAYVQETGGIKFTSLFSDYGTIIGEQNHQIISKELRRQKNAIADLNQKRNEDLYELSKIKQQLEMANYDSKPLEEKRNDITRRIYEINKYARQWTENHRLIDEEVLRDLITWN